MPVITKSRQVTSVKATDILGPAPLKSGSGLVWDREEVIMLNPSSSTSQTGWKTLVVMATALGAICFGCICLVAGCSVIGEGTYQIYEKESP